MMFVECAMLAFGAFALGALVAWWAPAAVMSLIEPIRDPHPARVRCRLAACRILRRPGDLRHRTLWFRARATGLVCLARHRAERRRRGALSPRRQVAARRPDDVLRVRPLRGRPLQDDVRSVVVAAARLLVRHGCWRWSWTHATIGRAQCEAADARDGRAPAGRGICGRGGLAAAAVGQRLEHHHPRRRFELPTRSPPMDSASRPASSPRWGSA